MRFLRALGTAAWHLVEAFYLNGFDGASWSEMVWTVNATFVALVSSVLLLERRRDMRALRRDATFVLNGPRHLSARMATALLLFVFAISLSMMFVGIAAMNTALPMHHLTPYAFLLNTTFLLFSFGLGYLAWFCWHEYQRLRDFYNRPDVRTALFHPHAGPEELPVLPVAEPVVIVPVPPPVEPVSPPEETLP